MTTLAQERATEYLRAAQVMLIHAAMGMDSFETVMACLDIAIRDIEKARELVRAERMGETA